MTTTAPTSTNQKIILLETGTRFGAAPGLGSGAERSRMAADCPLFRSVMYSTSSLTTAVGRLRSRPPPFPDTQCRPERPDNLRLLGHEQLNTQPALQQRANADVPCHPAAQHNRWFHPDPADER